MSGPLADLATEHGLGFGWAAPVSDGEQPVAVLVLFPGAKRFPSAHEQRALEAGLPLAQVAIASHRVRTAAQRATRDDPLTGVLGRQAFLAELAQLARRSRDALGLVAVHVDGVAGENERAGFAAGDALLQAVGSRLAATVRGRDVVGRVSGTRFAVACASFGPGMSIPDFARRVQRVLDEPVAVDGGDGSVPRTLPLVVRVATATRRGRLDDPEAILRDALRSLDDATNATARVAHRDRRSGAGRSDR